MRIIAGEARGRTIEAPPGKHTRPTLDRVRENMFNMLQADIPGSRILDLFAGSGAAFKRRRFLTGDRMDHAGFVGRFFFAGAFRQTENGEKDFHGFPGGAFIGRHDIVF